MKKLPKSPEKRKPESRYWILDSRKNEYRVSRIEYRKGLLQGEMGTFEYKARDKSGKLVSGVAEAETEDLVASNLRKQGFLVSSVSLKRSRLPKVALFERLGSVKSQDVAIFTRQLATLIDAGVPIITALRSINEQTDNAFLRDALAEVTVDIEGGKSLAEAMSKHPKCFDQTYLSMVNAAETSGTLAMSLERLAILLEYEEQTRNKIKSATRYPITVTAAMVIAFFLITMLVLPRFAKIYSRFGTALPIPTKILLGIHFVIMHYWYLVILGIVIAIFAFYYFINTKKGRGLWDTFRIKVPIFGPLLLKISLSRFMRISGIMLKTGVPILRVLDHGSGVSGNVNIAGAINRVRDGVNVGKDIGSMMKKEQIFPAIAVQMIALGEESGKLDDLLVKTSDFFDSQVDVSIQNMTSLLEPVLILVLGCGVLTMALAVFLPIWNLVYLFKKK